MKSGPTAGNNANPHHVGGGEPPLGLHEGFCAFFLKQRVHGSRTVAHDGRIKNNGARVVGQTVHHNKCHAGYRIIMGHTTPPARKKPLPCHPIKQLALAEPYAVFWQNSRTNPCAFFCAFLSFFRARRPFQATAAPSGRARCCPPCILPRRLHP